MATREALTCFFARTYWYRVWVIQEVVWAEDVIIMCGAREMSWKSVLGGSFCIEQTLAVRNVDSTMAILQGFTQTSFITQMMEIRAKRIGSSSLGLHILAMSGFTTDRRFEDVLKTESDLFCYRY